MAFERVARNLDDIDRLSVLEAEIALKDRLSRAINEHADALIEVNKWRETHPVPSRPMSDEQLNKAIHQLLCTSGRTDVLAVVYKLEGDTTYAKAMTAAEGDERARLIQKCVRYHSASGSC